MGTRESYGIPMDLEVSQRHTEQFFHLCFSVVLVIRAKDLLDTAFLERTSPSAHLRAHPFSSRRCLRKYAHRALSGSGGLSLTACR